MNHPSIYLITGVMASGKSTVAELLAKNMEKCVHLHGDVFRKMITSGRVDMSEKAGEEAFAQLYLRYRITATVAKEYFKAGFNVVVQDNYYGKALTDMIDLLSPCAPKVIVLNPSLDAVRKREQKRDKKGYTGFDAQTLYAAFHAETPKIGLWVDTSDMTPEETAKRILEHF